jgi:cellulose synthase/poly-beta-1,6-N-acetylglucosamine synthase-like glycosyltransferase
VLTNLAGDRASGLNLALSTLDADLVALLDAQVVLDRRYLERGVQALERSRAAVAGGPYQARGRTAAGRAIAIALASRIGIGNGRFVRSNEAKQSDAVNLGIYRASTFKTVGGFNSALLRTEDDDMFARIRDSGLTIWLDPSIQSTYFCRDSFWLLARQFYGYGYWKVALATIRPRALKLRHFAPVGLILFVVASAIMAVVRDQPAFLALSIPYLAAVATASLGVGEVGWRERLFAPIAVCTMHFSYGIGTIAGLLKWRSLRRRALAGAEAAEAAR